MVFEIMSFREIFQRNTDREDIWKLIFGVFYYLEVISGGEFSEGEISEDQRILGECTVF